MRYRKGCDNKNKIAFKRKYQEFYLNHGFIATVDSLFPHPFGIIYSDQLVNEAKAPPKLLSHMETKHSALKEKPLEFFARKIKQNKKQTNRPKKRVNIRQKQLLRAATSTNMSALKASFLVVDLIGTRSPLLLLKN